MVCTDTADSRHGLSQWRSEAIQPSFIHCGIVQTRTTLLCNTKWQCFVVYILVFWWKVHWLRCYSHTCRDLRWLEKVFGKQMLQFGRSIIRHQKTWNVAHGLFFCPFWTLSLYWKQKRGWNDKTEYRTGVGWTNPSITDTHHVRYISDACVS